MEHCTHASAPFFPLIAIFEYFFFLAAEKQAMECLHAYLFNVSCLDWGMVREREAKAIRRTVLRAYHCAANEWEEGAARRVRKMMESYRLYQFL